MLSRCILTLSTLGKYTSRLSMMSIPRHLHMCTSRQILVHKSSICFLVSDTRSVLNVPKRTLMDKTLDEGSLPHYDEEKGRLIYIGNMSRMVRAVKAFSLSTSMLGLAAQPIIYKNSAGLPPALLYAVSGVLGFFVFLTPFMLHLVTKRYVTNIYYKPETKTFTANTYTFFLTNKQHRYTAADVEVLRIPRLFSTVQINQQPMFVVQESFIDIDAGTHMLGYDKPMEWTLPEEDLINDDDDDDDDVKKK